jgi:hypothetical protein
MGHSRVLRRALRFRCPKKDAAARLFCLSLGAKDSGPWRQGNGVVILICHYGWPGFGPFVNLLRGGRGG